MLNPIRIKAEIVTSEQFYKAYPNKLLPNDGSAIRIIQQKKYNLKKTLSLEPVSISVTDNKVAYLSWQLNPNGKPQLNYKEVQLLDVNKLNVNTVYK